MDSIFPVLSLDRNQIAWECYLHTPTPWENHRGVWFKRDDYFAPIGYGGPGGSKLRQLIWYVTHYAQGKTHVLSGASVQSPQLTLSTMVAAHYGYPITLVVYSTPKSLLTHEQPCIAYGLGAEFAYAKGPYNPIIQRTVQQMSKPDSLVVQYGITIQHDTHSAAEIRAFHEAGADQVANMPAEVETLIVPAGSCNSLTSVMLGLSKTPGNLRKLFTIGIGPNKIPWMLERLAIIGVDHSKLPFQWQHYSLHDHGYASYSERFDGEAFDGIAFHPTYEAKMWRWLRQTNGIEVLSGGRPDSVGFWIVGGPVNAQAVKRFFVRDVPEVENLR